MAAKSILNILKRIGLSLRRNWGLKLASLFFAVILWNYVIIALDPARTVTFSNIPVEYDQNSITMLHNSGFSFVGAPPEKTVDVSVEIKRSKAGSLKRSDIHPRVDLSGISSAGEKDAKITVALPFGVAGTVSNISPDTMRVTIERLDTRTVPVICVPEGTLPQGYWRGEFKVTPATVDVSGAGTLIRRVASARISVTLDSLTQTLSAAREIVLLDADGEVLPTGGFSSVQPASCIVNLDVLPTRTIRIDTDSALSGKVARGFEVTAVEASPREITVAGPPELLGNLETLPVEPLAVGGLDSDVSGSRRVVLPAGVFAVGTDAVTVHASISEKMATVTLDSLRVAVRNLGTGLVVETKNLSATVTVTCPERAIQAVMKAGVTLFVDAGGLDDRTHTLPVKAEYGEGLGITDVVITPSVLVVKLAKAAETIAPAP